MEARRIEPDAIAHAPIVRVHPIPWTDAGFDCGGVDGASNREVSAAGHDQYVRPVTAKVHGEQAERNARQHYDGEEPAKGGRARLFG